VHAGIPLSESIAIWAVAAVFLLRGLQYVLVARVYLTCAVRSLRFEVAYTPLAAEDRLVFESADAELASAGFRLLFVGQVNSFLTLSDEPEFFRVFTADAEPFRAIVGRRRIPEMGAVITIELETTLADGTSLVTKAWRSIDSVSLPGRVDEIVPYADLAGLKERHRERVAASPVGAGDANGDVTAILRELNAGTAALRSEFRAKGYTVPTSDLDLDRFTLVGAFKLAHGSIKRKRRLQKPTGPSQPVPVAMPAAGLTPVLGPMPALSPRLASSPTPTPARQAAPKARTIVESDTPLRIAADIIAVRRVADHPIRPPGSDSALWVMMLVTGAVSFLGMSFLWSPLIATIILAVVAFHEAGHAMAMRFAGYRDVNVFFVPFVGALTVGRDMGASVKQRLAVMLAGPVPGLWLAVVVFVLLHQYDTLSFLKPLAVALLLVNGLNLLPLTPLDGGRALELVTSPDSVLRIGIQGASGLGLLGLGVFFTDGFLILVGAWWLLLLRRQSALLGLRRQVARQLAGRREPAVIIQTVCGALTSRAYASWRGTTRLNTTRVLVQQFSGAQPTGADRLQAILLYVFAWIPAALALYLWKG
jgi:Zn-dependent protease